MFKVVIFDLVGVFSKHKNVYSILKKITNYDGTAEGLHSYIGDAYDKLIVGKMNELVFWNKLKKETGSRKTIDSLKKSFLKEFKPVFKHEDFEKIKKNFKVALCSNFVNSWWMYLKDKFKISFDYEVLSSSLKIKKPEPEIFLSVSSFFKISPYDCVYVSDEAEDMKAAKKTGMQTIFIPGKTKSFKNADYYYTSVENLLEVLA
ncbi:MAG: HAD-IA family hydrolase [Nanoarchaeota archaeon]|nr:HAD-IA family hydrolase [Nanoarchaeota archaeon]